MSADHYALGVMFAESSEIPNAVVVLQAEAHQWGNGKTHLLNGDLRTQCGRSVDDIPGTPRVAVMDVVDCLLCVRSLEARQRQAEREAQWQEHQREWNEQRREEDRRWRDHYESYLLTEEWQSRRARVLERALGVCEGCRERRATQVHHLTYTRVGAEMLFDLVAVCDDCRSRIHRR